MKNVLLSTVAVFALTSTAYAGSIGGEAELTFTQNDADDYVGALALEIDVTGSAGGVSLGFVTTSGEDLTLDTWTLGTTLGDVGVAIGNDNSVFVEAEGEQTIAAPAMTESLKVTAGDAAIVIGFTDWASDISDISNVQGAYSLSTSYGSVTTSIDYNFNSENTVLGAAISDVKVSSLSLGAVVTYDVDAELAAYEGIAKIAGLTAYINGDQDDALQNFGGEYAYNLGGAELTAGAVYNFDSEEVTPTAGITFSF